MKNNYSSETIMVHGDYSPNEHNRSRMVPIYQTSAFCYDNVQHAADLFALNQPGYIYMRLNNPTVDEAEKRIALLEKGVGAVAFSSGMAAISGLIFNMLKSGDEIIAASCLYGGERRKFCVNRFETSSLLARIGIKLFESERKIFYENNT